MVATQIKDPQLFRNAVLQSFHSRLITAFVYNILLLTCSVDVKEREVSTFVVLVMLKLTKVTAVSNVRIQLYLISL